VALGITVGVGDKVADGIAVSITVAITNGEGEAVVGAQLPSRRVVKMNRKASCFIHFPFPGNFWACHVERNGRFLPRGSMLPYMNGQFSIAVPVMIFPNMINITNFVKRSTFPCP
jgi:hypothetical protein